MEMVNCMKKLIKKLLPQKIRNILIGKYYNKYLLKRNYKFDMKKYLKYSFDFGVEKTKRHYEADLIFYYHKIEKALSLPNPRVGFGKSVIEELIKKLEHYTHHYGWDEVSLISLNTLEAYYKFNKENNVDLPDLLNTIKTFKKNIESNNQVNSGGVIEINRNDIAKMSNINFKDFVYSRYSIRNFAPGEVSLDLIEEAVYIAQKTPSVCNRQSARVYVYSDENIKKEVLKYQNGNAGFGEHADKILIVTEDLRDFRGAIERNQCFIDGGLYSMTLLYALHSLGVGACPLNLCLNYKTELKLKEVAKIDDHEALIMMIVVGNIPEKLKVAASPRRKVEDVMTVY